MAVHGPKIRDIRPDNDEPIRAMIRYIMTLIGLTESQVPKDEATKNVLINTFRQDLGHYGLDEIRVAFHLAINGRLGIDVNTYGAFSAKYVCMVMKAYSEHVRGATISKFKLIEATAMEAEKTITPEEKIRIKHEFYRESLIKPWLYFLKTGTITFGINPWRIIYESLFELKLINLTVDEKKAIQERAVKILEAELNQPRISKEERKKVQDIREKIEAHGIFHALESDIVSKCHELAIRDCFHQAKQDGEDLEHKIETAINHENESIDQQDPGQKN